MWSIAWIFLQGAAPAQPPAPSAPPSVHQVLQAEHARGADMQPLWNALQSADTVLQRIAVRGVGRIEHEPFVSRLAPMLESPAASVRREAVLAGAQLRAVGFGVQLVTGPTTDPSADVRATVYASLGRTAPGNGTWEATIAWGLRDTSLVVRRGAARGLEAFYRRHRRAYSPADSVLRLLESLTNDRSDRDLTLLAVMARTTALGAQQSGTRVPPATWPGALRAHRDPQVRRTITAAFPGFFVKDTSALVRIEQARTAERLDRLEGVLRDADEHVQLMAIDQLASPRFPQAQAVSLLQEQLVAPRNWRTRAHAVAALARRDAGQALPHIASLARDSIWQARAWAARAARVARDDATLRLLVRDAEPNVRLEAISSIDDALRALEADHAGLLLAAAEFLVSPGRGGVLALDHVSAAARTFERISRSHGVTWRDPRVKLLEVIVPHIATHPTVNGAWIAQWLRDADPEIQRLAIQALPDLHRIGANTPAGVDLARVSPYVPPPFASEAELNALQGASAELTIRGKGTIVLDLLEEMAPMTVVTFARLAERGAYNGRTLHRVVPNFVVQGGSPGADEYDPATDFFMRDEVGAPNVRGSLGISTRGRDTGDGQFYFNLVDNVRLDYDYTVFANIVRGLDVMDALQEGDVIASVVIRRPGRR